MRGRGRRSTRKNRTWLLRTTRDRTLVPTKHTAWIVLVRRTSQRTLEAAALAKLPSLKAPRRLTTTVAIVTLSNIAWQNMITRSMVLGSRVVKKNPFVRGRSLFLQIEPRMLSSTQRNNRLKTRIWKDRIIRFFFTRVKQLNAPLNKKTQRLSCLLSRNQSSLMELIVTIRPQRLLTKMLARQVSSSSLLESLESILTIGRGFAIAVTLLRLVPT